MLRKNKDKLKSKEPYFGKSVENAIIKYNTSTSQLEKNQLYEQKIGPAFNKLSEVLINTYKFYHINEKIKDTQNEVIVFLLEKLDKYTPDKGKAFSYFHIVARNYLIISNTAAYKHKNSKADTSSLDEIIELAEATTSDRIEFMDKFVDYLEYNLHTLFPKKQEYLIAEAIITLIRHREKLPVINKKALYVYLKEITDEPTLHITKVLTVYKNVFKRMNVIYLETDELDFNYIPNKWS